MKGKLVFLALVMAVILLAVFFVLQANSMPLALRANDLQTDVSYIEQPFSDDGKCYAILQTRTEDGRLALVHAEKNSLGFWTVNNVKADQQYVSLSWLKVADVSSRTDYQMQSDGRYEWHYVCCGNDAIGNIQLTSEQLPENVTISVRQTGQEYTVHLISFSKDGLSDFSLRQILIDNGFVPAA